MTNKELREYLELFDDNKDVCFLIANPSKRVFYREVEQFVITDMDKPCICIEIVEEYPMDDEMKFV